MIGKRLNTELVVLEELSESDELLLADLLERHEQLTGSVLAQTLRSNLKRTLSEFVKVMPTDYRRVLEATRLAQEQAFPSMTRDHGGRSWRDPKGGFCDSAVRARPDDRSSPPSAGLARGLPAVPGGEGYATRRRAAWTAASRSATKAARSAISSRSGTTSSIATSSTSPSNGSRQPTTFRSSPGCLCPARAV